MPGTTSADLPSFSHDQHHETDAAKRKGGWILLKQGQQRWWSQLELQYVQSSSQTVITNKLKPIFVQTGLPFLSANQQCQSTEGKKHQIPQT